MPRKPKRQGVIVYHHLADILTDILELPTIKQYPAEGFKIAKAIFTTITNALQRGEEVYIKGFGKFKPITRKPRRTSNDFIYNGHIHGQPNVHATSPAERRPRTVIIFIPSYQLMALLNHKTPNHWEARAMSIWDSTPE